MSGISPAARFFCRVVLFALCCLASLTAHAQSTFGSILGTVRDSSGAVIPGAAVTLINAGTAALRTAQTDQDGNYAFNNIDAGVYELKLSAASFAPVAVPLIQLTAREVRRVDAVLQPASTTQTIEIIDPPLVINTETSGITQTKIGEELVRLPVAVFARSTGSTSPISTLTTEAGVQVDDTGNLAVMGTTPALLSLTIDGISSVGVEYSGPVNEMFPSFNSIEEIQISALNNNAEFSGVADITTVSKAGTIKYHGGVFENHQNTVFNAGNPFALSKPKIIMNDFGGTLGGPLRFRRGGASPSTFFFISYEGLRLPRETPIVLSVPSMDMRNGNLVNYIAGQGVDAIYQPDGTPIDPANVPVSSNSAAILEHLFPTPNIGAADSYANNYQINFPSPISTNQGDIRLDHNFSDKQRVFARFSYKNRQVITAPSADCVYTYCAEAGSPLQGGYNTPEIDEGLTFAHTYVFTPALLNEFRGGYNAQHTSETQSYSTTELLDKVGLTVPQPSMQYSEAPQVLINGFMSTGAGNPGVQRGQIIQLLDNVTWIHHTHTFKFGADLKRISDHDDNVFGNYRSGWYVFDGSSPVGTNIGDPYAAFLLGYPDWTEVSTTNRPTMDGLGYSYAFFAQDDWKVTPSLTLNLGLRYELHPPIKEQHGNTAFFQPDFNGAGTDGTTVHGTVVVPSESALQYTSADFAGAIAPTPITTANQAGIPTGLHFTDHQDWGPRIGFAWRPFHNEKTVLRGGWGRFIETPLGFSLVAGWAVHSSYVGTYNQAFADDGVTPLLSFQDPFNSSAGSYTGTAGFYYAYPIHYQDPSVQQWNLTFERDLGRGTGMRLSYAGSHGHNLDAMVDLNQVPANPYGYYNTDPAPAATGSCITNAGSDGTLVADHRPYPCWSVIQSVVNAAESNYNSATAEVSRRAGSDLTFDASYTWTRDLSNAGGSVPNAFAISGGTFLTDRFHPGRDYGNVMFDRRHRFLATYLYELPFGRGKQWLNSGGALNQVIGGWQLGGVTIWQSGAFLTPYQQSIDPANTNILTTVGQARTDQLPHVPLYAQHRTTAQWLNPDAFPYQNLATPDGNGIGRFGNAPVGAVVGPGTVNFSVSTSKGFSLTEGARLLFTVEAANLFNHRNYETPNMQVDSSGFGAITGLSDEEGAGPRSLELAARITF
ncbi:TonB-dependent receptor [Occallatibacter riparius]|uniref:Carboxypeptidase regulatory-like domain-containing protein n=1 Tax=Occallatibacter riparius TaxID=1002689 RepID=A0A9J7BQP1_9BACT|nr:carboxypeptidase regulatory-like domain-containing protein [Occallatibacter riparius]UWZ83262.1 carboxypeptidase regulatory-like domain-containing protein [Occallatibacter riparius]